MKDSVTLTVVLNLHHEGKLVHPTVRSIARALDRLAQLTDSVAELVPVLDRPDQATEAYVRDILVTVVGGVEIRPIVVDNGDLGLSRNSGTAAARGRFIAFCDGDNLVSADWFRAAIAVLAVADQPTVVHPSYVVAFEARDTIWKIRSSTDDDFDPFVLAQSNLWDATAVTTAELARAVPYHVTRAGEGFGPEDWHWNLETLGAGAAHVTADGTALFYRAKHTGSLLAEHEAGHALLPRSSYLRDPRIPLALSAKSEIPPIGASRRKVSSRVIRTAARGALRVARHVSRDGRMFNRLAKAARKSEGPLRFALQQPPSGWGPLPEWLVQEWRSMQTLDPFLYPEPGLLKTIDYWDPQRTPFAEIYWALVEKIIAMGPVDALFLVPWLNPGGADQVTLNYVHALLEDDPLARIVILGTESSDSSWADRVPGGANFISVPDAYHALGGSDQELLLGQLVVQLAPPMIHLINSHVGFRVIQRFGKAIASQSSIFLSVFTIDHWASGRRWHYAFEGIRDYAEHVTGIFTDNSDLRDLLLDTYALPGDLVTVHYQPVDGRAVTPQVAPRGDVTESEPLRVLWAGRFDRQKRLDLLGAVATRAKELKLPLEFHAYGKSLLESEGASTRSIGKGGVAFHGPFRDGIVSIGDDYDCYLNTSQWEGLPLILLEATAIGMPSVASDVGGTSEVLVAQSAQLVSPFDSIDGYISALMLVASDVPGARDRASRDQALVLGRHSWHSFMQGLRSTRVYFR